MNYSADADIVQEVLAWQEAVMEFDSEVIGKSHVLLEGRAEICRLRECNLGRESHLSCYDNKVIDVDHV